jgi:hypothetical protein
VEENNTTHRPEDGLLYNTVQTYYETFLSNIEEEGRSLPKYIQDEFAAYLSCGIHAHGFFRLKCESCNTTRLVAFSCKKRGFCPSCGGRRMNETAAHLVDEIFPRVAVRQWVLSVPYQLRYWLASNAKLQTRILQIVTRALDGYYKKKAKKQYSITETVTGSVTLIQRFGSAINLNVHYHILLLDGVYSGKEFYFVEPPTDEEVLGMVTTLYKRIVRYLQKYNYIDRNTVPENPADEFATDNELLAECISASISSKIATGTRRGKEVRKVGAKILGYVMQDAELRGRRCAYMNGFSLHADTVVGAENRTRLESLCRYITRPAISEARLSKNIDGNLLYELKKPYTDGTTHVLLSPLELLEKLVSLVPLPRANLTRYHGILAPHAKYRSKVVPKKEMKQASQKDENEPEIIKQRRLSWAQLLKRVFNIDIDICPKCGDHMRMIGAVTDRKVIRKILLYVGIPPDPPELTPAVKNTDWLFAG